jgi:RNA polymerase sigma-70 factor (ECF subfamily)
MVQEPEAGDEEFASLIARAKSDREAMGRLVEMIRPYLLGVSNAELPGDLRAKIAASDVVQDSLLEVVRDFQRFNGTSAAEFRVWVRTLLLNNLANWERWFRRAGKRAIVREIPIDGDSNRFAIVPLLASGPSPSDGAKANEQVEALHRAMADLPEHYRQVLELRHWQHLSFEEIGKSTQRTTDASRMLWWRAVDRLQELLGAPGER